MEWSREKVELLKLFFERGCSASIITDKLHEAGYNATRNSVIGKLHRLGLSGTKQVEKHIPTTVKPRSGHNQYTRKNPVLPPAVIANLKEAIMVRTPNHHKKVRLTETKEGDCRAIIDYEDNLLANAVCCGEEAVWVQNNSGVTKRSAWCAYHHERYTTVGKK